MFNEIIVRPILNTLLWIYNTVPGADLGVAIVIITIAIRVLLIPMAKQGMESQHAMQKIQPELKKIRAKYQKSDPQKMTQETLALYKRENIHPFSGFVPLLIQLPVIFGIIRVINILFPRNGDGLDRAAVTEDLYSFVSLPEVIETSGLFGLIPDLAAGSIILALLAGIAQFIQSKLTFRKRQKSAKKEKGPESMMQTQMIYVLPAITVIFAANLPAAFALYWFVATAFAAVQQAILLRSREESN